MLNTTGPETRGFLGQPDSNRPRGSLEILISRGLEVGWNRNRNHLGS